VFAWGNAEYGQIPAENNNQQINSPKHLSMCEGFGKIIDVATGGSYCLMLNGK
jgi:RCC1-like G exchanging factor-like protein